MISSAWRAGSALRTGVWPVLRQSTRWSTSHHPTIADCREHSFTPRRQRRCSASSTGRDCDARAIIKRLGLELDPASRAGDLAAGLRATHPSWAESAGRYLRLVVTGRPWRRQPLYQLKSHKRGDSDIRRRAKNREAAPKFDPAALDVLRTNCRRRPVGSRVRQRAKAKAARSEVVECNERNGRR